MKKRKVTWKMFGATALGLAALGGVGAAAIANAGGVAAARTAITGETDEDAREAQALTGARVSLADAARLAEQRTGLRAAEAELDDESATPAWEISLGAGAAEKTVVVDAANGQVRSIAADDGEAEEGGEAEEAGEAD